MHTDIDEVGPMEGRYGEYLRNTKRKKLKWRKRYKIDYNDHDRNRLNYWCENKEWKIVWIETGDGKMNLENEDDDHGEDGY